MTTVSEDNKSLLQAQLTSARTFASVMIEAFHALKNYGVDYTTLPVYKENLNLNEELLVVKPLVAQDLTMKYLTTLSNAIRAAINRTKLKVIIDNSPTTTKH